MSFSQQPRNKIFVLPALLGAMAVMLLLAGILVGDVFIVIVAFCAVLASIVGVIYG